MVLTQKWRHRSMEQNREPRNKPMHLCLISLWQKEARIYNGEKTLSSINGVRRGFSGGAVVKNTPANAGAQVRALVQEDPTCCRATRPVRHHYWACALQPMRHNYWSLRATTTEAHAPRAHALQQEKTPQWEARAPQQWVTPACRN